MANLRGIKKDIDFVINEVVYDCYLAIFSHEDKRNQIVDLMQEAVDLRNNLFEMVSNPAEKHNKSLVKKHYKFVRVELLSTADDLFEKLSAICKK